MKTKILFFSLCALIFAGCKKEPYIIKSTLTVTNNFQVKNDNAKLVNLNRGSYPADVNINSERVKVTLKTAASNGVTFRLLLPKNVTLPKQGQLVLSSAQSKQPFDTVVNVTTTIKDGPVRQDYEDCSYGYGYGCNYYYGYYGYCSRWGFRTVEYFVRSYDRHIAAKLTSNGQYVGNIEGSRVDAERIYTRTGMCY